MKKIIAFVLVAVLAFALASCGSGAPSQYDDFMAAEVGSTVTVEAYVQGHQSWWDNKLTVYLQDENGGYFAYDMECTAEQAEEIEIGTKIKVTGKKAEWAGEIEIYNPCTLVEIIEGDTWVAPVTDVTAKMGTEDLINYMNRKVAFKGLEIVAYDDDVKTYSITNTMTQAVAPGVEAEIEATVILTFEDEQNFTQTMNQTVTNLDELADIVDADMFEQMAAGNSVTIEGTYAIADGSITITIDGNTSPAQSFAEGSDDNGEYIQVGEQKLYQYLSAVSYDPDKNDSDIYFKAKDANGNVVEFCVEYYLTNHTTDTYQGALELEIGDTVDVEGFLYWYNGANPHVTKITVAD